MLSSSREINVMLVDDSAVIRGALTRLLESSSNIKVTKSIANGSIAVDAAKLDKPDIVILDIEMPVMDGLTALPKILEASPQSKVIMFSSLTEKGATVTLEAFKLGAVECIVKPSSAQEVGEGSEFQKRLISLIESLVPAKAAPRAKISAPPSSTTTPTATTATTTINCCVSAETARSPASPGST